MYVNIWLDYKVKAIFCFIKEISLNQRNGSISKQIIFEVNVALINCQSIEFGIQNKTIPFKNVAYRNALVCRISHEIKNQWTQILVKRIHNW
jgi:hypothetical protein